MCAQVEEAKVKENKPGLILNCKMEAKLLLIINQWNCPPKKLLTIRTNLEHLYLEFDIPI